MSHDKSDNTRSQRNPEQSGNPSRIWWDIIDWLKTTVNELLNTSEHQKQSIDQFETELSRIGNNTQQKFIALENENKELRNRVAVLEDKVAVLEHQVEKLLSTVATLSQDPTSFTNPTSPIPQHYELKQTFHSLRNGSFSDLSEKLFKTCPSNSPLQQDGMKLGSAKIHSVLAKEILMNGIYLFQTDPPNSHDDLSSITNKSIQSVRNCLQEKYGVQFTDEIAENLTYLVHKSITLVRDMTLANPPGNLLWIEKDNEEFDSKKHEPRLRTEDSGIISLWIHPGYIEGDHIMPAWVITKPAELEKNG